MSSCLGYLCSSVSWGGLEMNHLRNAQWMQERRHRVLVFCVENSPIAKMAIEMGLSCVFIPQHKKYYDFGAARKVRKSLLEHGVTHLIIRATRDMSIAATLRFRMGNRLHVSYFMEMQLGVKKTHLLHSIRFRYIDLWSCPLNWLKTQVETMTNFKNTLVVIPSGLELSPFLHAPERNESREVLELHPDGFLFGLIGRFDPQKGQHLVLEAMLQIPETNFGVVFLGEPTIGEADDYYASIRETIRTNGLEDRVFIRPFRKDTPVFYSAVNWLIMATKAESIGMVTLESLACGTPVLGSNLGGTPEILAQDKGGRLFVSQDVKDLARQMREIVLEQPSFAPEQLRKLVEAYDHHSVCRQVEEALGLTSQSL